MGNDMFNDEQLAHLKDRADETERLRLALAEAHARIADLENPDFVNCDGLHADGKYPNTPHRPIGINRLYPCPACTALSRARETEDGASSTLVPERPGDSPSRCGLAFGQCRYQRRAAAESCALLSTPTPGLDMTQVLFPGSRPKPKPQTEDGAVREAAERLGRELSMHIATTPVHVVAAVQALLDAAKGGPDAS